MGTRSRSSRCPLQAGGKGRKRVGPQRRRRADPGEPAGAALREPREDRSYLVIPGLLTSSTVSPVRDDESLRCSLRSACKTRSLVSAAPRPEECGPIPLAPTHLTGERLKLSLKKAPEGRKRAGTRGTERQPLGKSDGGRAAMFARLREAGRGRREPRAGPRTERGESRAASCRGRRAGTAPERRLPPRSRRYPNGSPAPADPRRRHLAAT